MTKINKEKVKNRTKNLLNDFITIQYEYQKLQNLSYNEGNREEFEHYKDLSHKYKNAIEGLRGLL